MVRMNKEIAENITKYIAENISQIQNNGYDIKEKKLDDFKNIKGLQVNLRDIDEIDFIGGFEIQKNNGKYAKYRIIIAYWNSKKRKFFNLAVFRNNRRKMEMSEIRNGYLYFEYKPKGDNKFEDEEKKIRRQKRIEHFIELYGDFYEYLPIGNPVEFIKKLITLTEHRFQADELIIPRK